MHASGTHQCQRYLPVLEVPSSVRGTSQCQRYLPVLEVPSSVRVTHQCQRYPPPSVSCLRYLTVSAFPSRCQRYPPDVSGIHQMSVVPTRCQWYPPDVSGTHQMSVVPTRCQWCPPEWCPPDVSGTCSRCQRRGVCKFRHLQPRRLSVSRAPPAAATAADRGQKPHQPNPMAVARPPRVRGSGRLPVTSEIRGHQ